MRTCDVLIVGGGPAGSAAARELKQRGADVLVLDKETFPRLKLCAGWITPEVVRDLQLDVKTYPHRFLTFERLHIHIKGLGFRVPSVQHSIRRFEFDSWLLERSGAPVAQHTVRNIRAEPDGYVVDDEFRCRYLIGAGGTRRPVYRTLFREVNPARAVSFRPSRSNTRSSTTGRIRPATCGFLRRDCPAIRGTCPSRTAG